MRRSSARQDGDQLVIERRLLDAVALVLALTIGCGAQHRTTEREKGGESNAGATSTNGMGTQSEFDTRLCFRACEDPAGVERPVPLPRRACPDEEPVEGIACEPRGLVCGYGEGATAECRKYYECQQGTWKIPALVQTRRSNPCAPLPDGACPDVAAPDGTECQVGEYGRGTVPCQYPGLTCWCSPRGESFPGSPGTWQCYGPPKDTRCPAVLPNIGEGCSDPGISCNYVPNSCYFNAYSSVFCFEGQWEPGGSGLPDCSF